MQDKSGIVFREGCDTTPEVDHSQSVHVERCDTTRGLDQGRMVYYEALYLIGGETKLPINEIHKQTGLNRRKIAVLQREYLCAKLLGADVKKILTTVLGHCNTSSLSLEYHFTALVIQELLDSQKFEFARFFLCLGGDFLKFININYSDITELTEDVLRSKMEVISRKHKRLFNNNNKKKEEENRHGENI